MATTPSRMSATIYRPIVCLSHSLPSHQRANFSSYSPHAHRHPLCLQRFNAWKFSSPLSQQFPQASTYSQVAIHACKVSTSICSQIVQGWKDCEVQSYISIYLQVLHPKYPRELFNYACPSIYLRYFTLKQTSLGSEFFDNSLSPSTTSRWKSIAEVPASLLPDLQGELSSLLPNYPTPCRHPQEEISTKSMTLQRGK